MTRLFVVLLCLCISLTLGAITSIDEGGKIKARSQRFVDQDGRERLFHGVNVVFKGAPFHPQTDAFDPNLSFSEEDAVTLASHGFNAIRLGVMWPGVEPTRGNYNETYLAKIQEIMDICEKHDIYVIADMHQDCLSEKFCGEGVPLWAAIPSKPGLPFPMPLGKAFKDYDENGVPSAEECSQHSWTSYQFTDALGSAYQNLYTNHSGLADAFSNFWAKVATEVGSRASCLGYELINEPFAGDVIRNPLLLIPGVTDREFLAPLYDTAYAAVRAQDPDTLIMFAGTTWDDLGVGFKRAPGAPSVSSSPLSPESAALRVSDTAENRARVEAERVELEAARTLAGERMARGEVDDADADTVLVYHYYSNVNFNLDLIEKVRAKDLARLNVPGFLTEFEMGSMDEKGLSEMRATAEHSDAHLQSWTGWEYKSYDPITGANHGFFPYGNSTLGPAVSVLGRAYAPAVAGRTVSMAFDADTAQFTLVYTVDATCKLPTEVFVNEALHYPSGFTVELLPAGAAEWTSTATNWIAVTASTSTASGTQITVQVTPPTQHYV